MRRHIRSLCLNSSFLGCILFAIISIMIFAAYCGTLQSPIFLDDFHSFVYQEKVFIKDLSLESLRSISETVFGWKRWIPMFTFALNHKYGGSQLAVFHATNILIHILVMLSVFLLINELFKLRDRYRFIQIEEKHCQYFALCIAAIWSLHPVQTSSVTYLVQRMASIQALFYILSVALFIRARRIHLMPGRSYAASYIGSFLSGLCAFFSKENSYFLPVMLLLTEIWFFQPRLLSILWSRFKNSRRLTKLLLSASALIVARLAYLYLQTLLAGYATRDFTMFERVLTESRVVVWYISLLLWPDPFRLSMEHDFSISRSLIDPPTTLLCCIFLLALMWQIFHQRKRLPLITYGGLWFFANLAIESSIFPLELVFEHRLYLPSIGFIFIFVLAAAHLLRLLLMHRIAYKEWLAVSFAFLIMLSSGLTLLTYCRNDAWSDPVSINMDSALKASRNPRSHSNLANALIQAGQFDEAIAEAEKCIELGKGSKIEAYSVAANAIVLALLNSGQIDKAIQRGEELIANLPENADVDSIPLLYINYSRANLIKGEYKKAFDAVISSLHTTQISGRHYAKTTTAVQVLANILTETASKEIDLNGDGKPDPGNVPVATWIAIELHGLGNVKATRDLLSESIASNPDDPETNRLAELLQKEDEDSEKQKVKSNFNLKYVANPSSRFNMCMALAYLVQEHQMPSPFLRVGESALDYCLETQPDSADAHLLKGWYYHSRHEFNQAIAEAERTLQIDPEYAKAWIGYGFFLAKSNKPDKAVAAINKALELHPRFAQRDILQAFADGLRSPKPAKSPELSEPGARVAKPTPHHEGPSSS